MHFGVNETYQDERGGERQWYGLLHALGGSRRLAQCVLQSTHTVTAT
jgi:hypothetical protein